MASPVVLSRDPDSLAAAHAELRRLLKEYQRLGGIEGGGSSAIELLGRIRALGRHIHALRSAAGHGASATPAADISRSDPDQSTDCAPTQ